MPVTETNWAPNLHVFSAFHHSKATRAGRSDWRHPATCTCKAANARRFMGLLRFSPPSACPVPVLPSSCDEVTLQAADGPAAPLKSWHERRNFGPVEQHAWLTADIGVKWELQLEILSAHKQCWWKANKSPKASHIFATWTLNTRDCSAENS